MILSDPVRRGDVVTVTFELRYDGQHDPIFRPVVTQPIEQLDLALQVDGRRPRRVYRCGWRGADPRESETVSPSRRRRAGAAGMMKAIGWVKPDRTGLGLVICGRSWQRATLELIAEGVDGDGERS